MRVPFDRVFTIVDGQIIPQMHVRIGNVTNAIGVPVPAELRVGGTEIDALIGQDLDVDREGGIIVINGFYLSGIAEDQTH
jgi:hypothetical protein